MDIKLTAKLRAFTKVEMRTKLSQFENDVGFITDAPIDGKIYTRKDGDWHELSPKDFGDNIELEEDSGLKLRREDGVVYLSTDSWFGNAKDLPDVLDEHTIYYAYEDDRYTLAVNGGTAFNDTEEFGEEVVENYDASNASVTEEEIDIELLPLPAEHKDVWVTK